MENLPEERIDSASIEIEQVAQEQPATFLGSPEEGRRAIRDLQNGKRGDILLGNRGRTISVAAVINSIGNATKTRIYRRRANK